MGPIMDTNAEDLVHRRNSSPSRGSPPSSASASDGPPPKREEDQLDVSSIFETLSRGKWVILLTCVVVAGGVTAYTHTQPRVYKASSLVKVDPQSGGESQITKSIVSEGAIQQSTSLAGEVGVLKNSVELARRVARALREQQPAPDSGQGFPVFQNASGGAQNLASSARRILQKTGFVPRPQRNLIEIVVESEVPKEAAAVANRYARVYREHSRERARARVQAARTFLEAQADQQRQEIDRLEQQWKSFIRSNRLIERGQKGEHLTSKFNRLKERRDQLSFQLEKKQSQLELLRRQLRQFEPKIKENIMQRQKASGLRSQIRALEERIARIQAEAATYYAENPKLEGDTTRIRSEFPELARLLDRVNALESRKRDLTTQLVEQASGSGTTVQGEGSPIDRAADLRKRLEEKRLSITQLQSQVAALDSQITAHKTKLRNIPEQRIQRENIERKLKQAQSFHQTIMSKLQRAMVAEESELGSVELVQSAFVPSAPVRPNVKKNLILGLLLGLSFGIGLAFMKEAINTRLRRPEDVEERGYNLLGVVPDMTLEIERNYDGREVVELDGRELSSRLMPLLNPWSSVTENYRMIRVNVQDTEQESRNLLVTSAQKEEGKTVTAVNLAITEAMSGSQALLIDADMRKPSAHEMLGMSRTPGLANVVENMPEASCWQTLVDGLYFIPAGLADRAPAQILDSEQIPRLLDATQRHFDVVVIDTPPTQAASDAVVIGTQTHASAIVVSEANGDVRALDSAITSLRAANVRVAGVVLNQFDEHRSHLNDIYSSSYYSHDEEYEEYRMKALQNAEEA